MLGTATKRKKFPKEGPKLKVRLFDKVQTQETQKVQSEDESDMQSEILCPNLVNETQEVPPCCISTVICILCQILLTLQCQVY